jgi:hypothetical protein
MPLDVTMKQPYSRIVSAESKNYVAVRSDEDGVAAHGSGGEGGGRSGGTVVSAGLIVGTGYYLEGVAVEVERVSMTCQSVTMLDVGVEKDKMYGKFWLSSLSGVVIVQDDLYDFTSFEHDLIGVRTIDRCICCIGACGEDGVQGRHFRSDVCYVVKESTDLVLAIIKHKP